jgi:uncharacterized LabA/DUF88 family protein
MKLGNNYAFIDSQNLNLGIRDQGWQLDFRRFRRYLKDKYNIGRAFLFVGYLSENRPLYRALKNYGFNLVFKPTLRLPDGRVKGNVDAELVLHTMTEYKKYTRALIVTGDGDFRCLVDYLEKNRKLLHLMIPNKLSYSSLYRKKRHRIVFMSDLKNKLKYKKSGIAAGRNPLGGRSS